jgi:hypothetical protein
MRLSREVQKVTSIERLPAFDLSGSNDVYDSRTGTGVKLMRFKLGPKEFIADVEELQPIVSPHTGQPLQQIETEFEVMDEQENKELLDLRDGKEPLSSVADGKIWNIGNSSYSYQDSGDDHVLYTHRWTLTENEQLTIEKLIVGDIELEPYSYKEVFENGSLVIHARVLFTNEQKDALNKLKRDPERPYFPVVRQGIDNQPRLMRLGQTLWSRNDDEIKYQLVLVDKAYDDTKTSPGILQPQFPIMQNMVATTVEYLLELTNLLVTKGVITAEEQKKLDKTSDDKIDARLEEFDQVRNLDDWPSDY